jgi:TPR repeat protein
MSLQRLDLDDRQAVMSSEGSVCASTQELAVFREGAAMSKGTTTEIGLTNSYFANPFGPAQRREQHEALAASTFAAAFRAGVFVGQLRTRLGLPGEESAGPPAAAQALLHLIAAKREGAADGVPRSR